MNNESIRADNVKATAWIIGVLGTFLIGAVLVGAMYHYAPSEPITAVRAAERYKNLQDLKAADSIALDNYAWVDQGKGIVRLPIERALELTLREWQNPAAARSKLISRVEMATAPPPKAPEKPNPYE